MRSFAFVARRPAGTATVLCAGLFLALASPRATRADTNTPPTITTQPASGFGALGEDFEFSVAATGTAPVTYQWLLNGAGLPGETNTVLLLTNLTFVQSASYAVVVANAAGTIVSSNVTLTVQTNAPRRLGTGRILQVGSQVGVPITVRANGREGAVYFSLSYDTNAYANPVFLPANAGATVSTNLTQPATIGVTLALPGGALLPAGYEWIGLMRFDLATNRTALQGGLAFATNPVPIAAANTNYPALLLDANVEPQYVLVTSAPQLNRQSGLYEQQLRVSNPGATLMTNVDILVLDFGSVAVTNSLLPGVPQTNAIVLLNAQSNLLDYPFGDPLIAVDCTNCGYALDLPAACDFGSYLANGAGTCSPNFAGTNVLITGTNYNIVGQFVPFAITNVPLPMVQLNNLLPGETRPATMEFYVADHATTPAPQYSLYLADPLYHTPPPYFTMPVTLLGTRFANGTFLVEFPSQLGVTYYVQYAATPADLATNAQTVLPPINGTGAHIQWIDDGPPKTDSPPTNGSRFYQVITWPQPQ